MKNRHFVAIILSAVMVLTSCMPMSGMAAYAADNEDVQTVEAGETEEESVSPDHEEETEEKEEAAAPEAPEGTENAEETENAEAQEETGDAEAQEGTGDAEAPEGTENTEVPEGTENTEAPEGAENAEVPEGADPAEKNAEEEDSAEVAADEPAAQENEPSVQEEIEEPDREPVQILEPEQLEEDREAAAAGSTGGNVAQAIWTSENDTLYFYYGPRVSVGKTFKGYKVSDVWSGIEVTDTGHENPRWIPDGWDPNDYEVMYDWYNYPVAEYCTRVVFDNSFKAVKPKSMYGWFAYCQELKNLDIRGLDTSEVTTMYNLFGDCNSLQNIKLTGLDASKVKDMSRMFNGCSKIKTVNLSGFDTSDVTDMQYMFCGCKNLTSVNMSGFDTSNVTDMSFMFGECESLRDLDVSGFNTSKVKDMSGMFDSCSKLTRIDVSGFDTSVVTDMTQMFYKCQSVEILDLSRFHISRVRSMDMMFYCCEKLNTIICSSSSTNWGKIEYSSEVFSGCAALVGRDGSARVALIDVDVDDSTMAKAASLGGFFTPKSSSGFFFGKTSRGDMFNLAGNVKVTWKAVPGAKYYKVYREGVTNPRETQTEPVIVTSGLVGWDKSPGLTSGNAYRYKIVASLTGKGDSSGDSMASYKKIMYRLKTVVIRSVKNTVPGGVEVKYDKTTSGDSYVLQYSVNRNMSNAMTRVIKGANTTSYTIGGLKKGKTYYISIRVRKKVNGIDYYTTFGVPKKVTISK